MSFFPADQFEMTLEEFFDKTAHSTLPVSVQEEFDFDPETPHAGDKYVQFDTIGEDKTETIRDSIHMDFVELRPGCPECGVNVRIWDGFAHRVLWNKTWFHAVAFQPVSTRFETDRWDSPIEGFAFRLWQWDDPVDTFSIQADLFAASSTTTSTTPRPIERREAEDEEEEDEYSLENLFKREQNGETVFKCLWVSY